MIRIPKGTKDVLPTESYKWHYIEEKIREITRAYNISEIRTPVFEHTELFLRGVGDTTDIVNKEMYTFVDKGDRSMTLKPEGTAGAGRCFIEGGLSSLPAPLKMYYMTPVFRYEKPQAGRLREHHQFGIEIFGSSSPSIDAEVILVAHTLFKKLKIDNIELNINSIGCKTCRADYNKALQDYYREYLSEMCPTCQERFLKNPLRILDCKVDKCKEINKNAPSILDSICDDCKNHFESLKEYLTECNIPFKVNPTIVRGLDYYSKTVFEFVSNNIGSQGTVCGGGRYDGLIEQLGGKPTCGIGFGIGLERLILLMENLNIPFKEKDSVDIYFVSFGKLASAKALKLACGLRMKNIITEVDHANRSFKAQFKYANKIDAKFVAILGEDELENGEIKIKNMAKSQETVMKLEQFEKLLELDCKEILEKFNNL